MVTLIFCVATVIIIFVRLDACNATRELTQNLSHAEVAVYINEAGAANT